MERHCGDTPSAVSESPLTGAAHISHSLLSARYIQARIQGKAYRANAPPPPKISKDHRVLGYIYTCT